MTIDKARFPTDLTVPAPYRAMYSERLTGLKKLSVTRFLRRFAIARSTIDSFGQLVQIAWTTGAKDHKTDPLPIL